MPRSSKTDFEPLDLSVDDLLPADIELVMGYRGDLVAADAPGWRCPSTSARRC